MGMTMKLCAPLSRPKALVLPVKDNSRHIKLWSSEVSSEMTDFGRPNTKKVRILILNPSHHVHDNLPASFELLGDHFRSGAMT
ncbi:hypothetical protein PS1_038136 [Malus domestica]